MWTWRRIKSRALLEALERRVLEVIRFQIESQDLIPHGMDLFLLSSEPLDPRREAGLL